MPVVPATREAELEGSLEPGRSKLSIHRDCATALHPRRQHDMLSQKNKFKWGIIDVAKFTSTVFVIIFYFCPCSSFLFLFSIFFLPFVGLHEHSIICNSILNPFFRISTILLF